MRAPQSTPRVMASRQSGNRGRQEKTETVPLDGVELSMDAVGQFSDGSAVEASLRTLVAKYRIWIDAQRRDIDKLQGTHRETAEELLRVGASPPIGSIDGIAVLVTDAGALDP